MTSRFKADPSPSRSESFRGLASSRGGTRTTSRSPPRAVRSRSSRGATGQDYADGINTCLSDWIAENGAPIDFDMEVTSSEGAAQGAAAKSEFGPKQFEDYILNGILTMAPDSDCVHDSTDDVLDAVEEGEGFFDAIAGGISRSRGLERTIRTSTFSSAALRFGIAAELERGKVPGRAASGQVLTRLARRQPAPSRVTYLSSSLHPAWTS